MGACGGPPGADVRANTGIAGNLPGFALDFASFRGDKAGNWQRARYRGGAALGLPKGTGLRGIHQCRRLRGWGTIGWAH